MIRGGGRDARAVVLPLHGDVVHGVLHTEFVVHGVLVSEVLVQEPFKK